MTALPSIPCSAKNTSYLAMGCTSLAKVELNGISRLDECAFKNCTKLAKVFIGSSVTTITAASKTNAPFYGVKSGCAIYCAAASKPSGFGTDWNSISDSATASTTWSSDYLTDYIN